MYKHILCGLKHVPLYVFRWKSRFICEENIFQISVVFIVSKFYGKKKKKMIILLIKYEYFY